MDFASRNEVQDNCLTNSPLIYCRMNIFDSQKSVYIIIPVHNRRILTLSCLESLQKLGATHLYSIVVVDDDSRDGTREAISKHYPDVTVLVGDGNLWWTGAIAKGMQYAVTHQAEFVIWLNDDCILEPNTLSNLVEFLHSHPKTIAGAVCYSLETQTLEETGAQGRQRVTARPGEVVPVNEMSGYCVGFPIEVIKAVGVPNQNRFPHYYGDCSYTLRANRFGFAAYILGNVRVSHQASKSTIQDIISNLKSEQSIIQVFKSIFLSKKSPYFLRSQFFYALEKYGIVQGTAIFLIKFNGWMLKFIQSKLNATN
jgi:GT2 family glycosyltransferase